MTGPEQVAKAYMVASKAHQFQIYKDGTPKIVHSVRVALQAPQYDYNCQVVALLHDVVEKGTMTFEELHDLGFDQELIDAVDILTHRDEDTYDEYIDKIIDSDNPLALNTKIRDLYDKLDHLPKLQNVLNDKDKENLVKFQTNWLKLKKVQQNNGWVE